MEEYEISAMKRMIDEIQLNPQALYIIAHNCKDTYELWAFIHELFIQRRRT